MVKYVRAGANTEEFTPMEMDTYLESYRNKYHKNPRNATWLAMAGTVDIIKIDGAAYVFDIKSGDCLGTTRQYIDSEGL